ncbi:hypothetical protein EX30DRAFT_337559 [Ascodesmis nigricans]|uniref:Uncharacterized protein n=1 Tax=Ascodesmis nigricans TaxID=341454 RepID=A0A4S2N778_9PEZI|nr:hypothetical protein EX30DRAFT_337559 [Ascodesmis nigricans]
MPPNRSHRAPSTASHPSHTVVKRHKRPLLHPPPTSTTIYISRKTPFISGIKRIDTLLESLHKPIASNAQRRPMSAAATPRGTPGAAAGRTNSEKAVTVKATGRAIERLLQMGVFLMQRGDVEIRVETGTVGAVDDLVVRKEGGSKDGNDEEMRDVGEDDDEGEEEEQTVTRGVSVCQLIITRKL